ncbi:hypothetical protein Goshw_022578 [Gossypium schwendimanii]|uniref:DUF7745 domain-containing protein n=1 Tax=Gossypium schwendimanii TaxID=34291 RepID=A0A7J9MWR0_GOSSC|nr:hypothetical protein [Gossypium schwendimanii]
MEESITQVIGKNIVVRDWLLRTQKAKWDSIFTEKYGDIAHLKAINVDEQLIQAMVRFWDPAYQCFIFNQEDMTLTIEEYAALLRIDNVKLNKIYVKEPKPITFKKKLIKELVQNHPDILKRVDLSALAIYGLIIFSKVLRHIEVTIVDFFKKLRQGINPVLTILAETFRSLSSCRMKGEMKPPCQRYNLESTLDSSFCPVIQFIPVIDGLAQSEFAFTGEGYMKNVQDTRGKVKKEEEKAALAMIELRKTNVEYETMSIELMTSQPERQELKGKIRYLKNTLQAHQQYLDDLLKALEEKNGQHDRNIHAYEIALQEKNMHIGSLVNKIRKATVQIVQLLDEAEALSCQVPPSQRLSMSEFLECVRKQGDVARKFMTCLRARAMDAELNERIEKMKRWKGPKETCKREPPVLGQHPTPLTHLGQGIFVSNTGANPSDPIVPNFDDPVEIAMLKIDDHNAQDNAKELSLVPDLVLPLKFKAPDFEKYDGIRCPKVHIIMFSLKMIGYVNEDKLLIHCFQDRSATKNFADNVISGELIEKAMKSERMESPEISKRAVPVRKKEAETHMVGTESHYTSNPYSAQLQHRYWPPLNFHFSP